MNKKQKGGKGKEKQNPLIRIVGLIVFILIIQIVSNASKPGVAVSDTVGMEHNNNYEGKEVDDDGNYIGTQKDEPIINTEKEQSNDYNEKIDNKGEVLVHYLNIGQGDAIFIETPDSTVLIDGGNPGDGPSIEKYIRARGHNKVDILMGSHPHADHIGGLPHIIDNIEIGKIYLPRTKQKDTPTTKIFESLLMSIKNKGLQVTSPEMGEVILNENGVLMSAVNSRTTAHNLNDYSIAVKMDHGNISYMFAGDLEANGEKELLKEYKDNILVNVYKSNHHGSNTSSTKEFMKAMDPDDVVIQVGEGNRYGHPHQEIIKRYESMGLNIYRNDFDGTVVSKSNGTTQEIITGVTPPNTILRKWNGKINLP